MDVLPYDCKTEGIKITKKSNPSTWYADFFLNFRPGSVARSDIWQYQKYQQHMKIKVQFSNVPKPTILIIFTDLSLCHKNHVGSEIQSTYFVNHLWLHFFSIKISQHQRCTDNYTRSQIWNFYKRKTNHSDKTGHYFRLLIKHLVFKNGNNNIYNDVSMTFF